MNSWIAAWLVVAVALADTGDTDTDLDTDVDTDTAADTDTAVDTDPPTDSTPADSDPGESDLQETDVTSAGGAVSRLPSDLVGDPGGCACGPDGQPAGGWLLLLAPLGLGLRRRR